MNQGFQNSFRSCESAARGKDDLWNSNLGQRNSNACVALRRGEVYVSNVASEVNSCELKRTNKKQAATIVNAESEEFKKLVQNTCNVGPRNSLQSGRASRWPNIV
jgi:hypothetical protein